MHRSWTLAVLGAAFFVVVLDSTIVYVALPSIADELGMDAREVQWVISAYLVTFGGLLLLGGRVGDLLGRRRVFLAGIATFTTASVVCGFAPGAAVLVGARVLQGAGAAVMAPTALALLLTTFPPGAERHRALGIWGAIGGVGGTAGLLLGGPVTQLWGWQWIFLVNLPVGMVLLAASARLLVESRDASLPGNLDAAGALTVTASLVLLVLGITQASWPALGAAGLLMAGFVLIERRATAPLVPWRLVRSRRLVAGNVLLVVAGMCVDGVLLVLTLAAQGDQGMSPARFGLTAAVMTAASVAGSFVGQAVVTRVGVRAVAVAGTGLLALGCVALTTLPPGVGLVVFGAGLGAAFVSAQIAAVSGAAADDAGLAAGIADTSFAVGGALGVAVLSTIGGTRGALAVAAGVALVGLAVGTSLRSEATARPRAGRAR